MAEGWELRRVSGVIGLLAFVVALIALVIGIADGLVYGTDSFETFMANGTVQIVAAVAAVLTLVFGAIYAVQKAQREEYTYFLFGAALAIAGVVGLLLCFTDELGLKWASVYTSFAVIFIIAALVGTVVAGLSPTKWPAAIYAVLLIVMAAALFLGGILKDELFLVAAMLLVGCAGGFCLISGRVTGVGSAAVKGKMGQKAEKPVHKRNEKKQGPKFYEQPAEKAPEKKPTEKLTKTAKIVEKSQSVTRPQQDIMAIRKPEQKAAAPAAASVPAASVKAVEPKVEKEEPNKETKKVPTLPKMMNSRQAAAAARNAKEARYESEDLAQIKSAAEPQPASVSASAAEPAVESEPGPVSVAAFEKVPAAVTPMAAAPAAESAPAEEEPVDVEMLAAELGLEPDTPESRVRRACWNKGLRCRKDYGPHEIPVAFVKGNVAVFVDGDGAAPNDDAALKDEGWSVLHFPAMSITDGQAEAEAVAAAVKENVRAKKVAKRCSKR